MKILVCVKQVPDRSLNLDISDDKKGVKHDGVTYLENEFDRYAVEEALQIRDKVGGEVVVCTVGPERSIDALRKGLAMGADSGIHIIDDGLDEVDAYVVARLIAKAVQAREESFDLILTGLQSEDKTHAQTGPMLAELLEIASATTVVEATPGEGSIEVKRELEGGALEVVDIQLPAVLTIQTGINTPRYPTLPLIMKAKRKKVEKPTLEDLGFSSDGLAGERMTEVLELSYPEKGEGGRRLEGSTDEVVGQLVDVFKNELKII